MTRPEAERRRPSVGAVGLAFAALLILAYGCTWLMPFLAQYAATNLGLDLHWYLEATRRWLSTGSPYLPNELAGPWNFETATFIHPPVALLLFLPFMVLPTPLWWAIPLVIVASAVLLWRPAPWTWPLFALILVWPRTQGALLVGNTDMWVSAFVALGLTMGWPSLLIVVKPSFAPLLLVGAHTRRWWAAALVAVCVCLAFGYLWAEYVTVLINSPVLWTYSLLNLPLVLLPVIAWAGRTRRVRYPAATSDSLTARAPSS